MWVCEILNYAEKGSKMRKTDIEGGFKIEEEVSTYLENEMLWKLYVDILLHMSFKILNWIVQSHPDCDLRNNHGSVLLYRHNVGY